MGIKVITAALPAFTVAELRAHLRVSDGDEDDSILGYLAAAQDYAGHYTGRSIGEQTLELALDAFPYGAIELPRSPALSIASIKYTDSAGVEQTIDAGNYVLDGYDVFKSWAIPRISTTWPQAEASANSVRVQYVAGFITPSIKAALLLIVGHLYNQREDVVVGASVAQIPMGANVLLNTARNWGV